MKTPFIKEIANRLAAEFLMEWGMKKQDRVIIFLDNSIEYVIALYGVLKAGGIFIILNGSMKANKLQYIIRDAEANFLITQIEKAQVPKEALKKLPNKCDVAWMGDNNGPKTIRENFFPGNPLYILWTRGFRDLKS